VLTPLKKQITEIIDYDFGVLDSSGNILISLDKTKENERLSEVSKVKESVLSIIKIGNYLYYKIKPISSKTFYVYVEDKEKDSKTIIKLVGLVTKIYLKQYFEKHDKLFFIRSIVQKDTLENEIKSKCKTHKIENEKDRVVLIIKNLEKTEYSLSEIINNLFYDKKNDYVVELDNGDTVYIMEVSEQFEKQVQKTASIIIETLEQELLVPIVVGVGKISKYLNLLFESYESAKTACELGGIFETDKRIFLYSKLGIGMLVNKLNKQELTQFIDQIVNVKAFESLDEEILKTVQKFFENNLNISETARQMYLHRNTLVYRIEKVLKQTGMDVRIFDDAVFFKTAYMVKAYLEKLNDNT